MQDPLLGQGVYHTETWTEGSKALKYEVYLASILGIVTVILGIYSVFGYLDP